MFSRRKQYKTTVIDESAVPVHNIIDSIIEDRDLTLTYKKFPVTEMEVFACVDFVLDREENNVREDFLNFAVDYSDDGVILINTESLSNWVFLTCLSYGHAMYPNVTDVNTIFSRGIEHIMYEVLSDLEEGNEDFKASRIHCIAYDSFCESYGEISDNKEEIYMLLKTLEAEIQKYDNT